MKEIPLHSVRKKEFLSGNGRKCSLIHPDTAVVDLIGDEHEIVSRSTGACQLPEVADGGWVGGMDKAHSDRFADG